MAKIFDLARVLTTTTGTGPIALGPAIPGFLTFTLAGVVDGDTIDYAINDPGFTPTASETGTGTVTAGVLTRSVTKSTNSNAPIDLTGKAQVFICPRAETLNDASLFTTGALALARGGLGGSQAAATAGQVPVLTGGVYVPTTLVPSLFSGTANTIVSTNSAGTTGSNNIIAGQNYLAAGTNTGEAYGYSFRNSTITGTSIYTPRNSVNPVMDCTGDMNHYGYVYMAFQDYGFAWGYFPYLLNRDLDPASNDNTPAYLDKTA